MLSRDEDQEIWARVQQCDERALILLRCKYQHTVCRVIRRFAAPIDPDELENDVWLAVWKGRNQFRGEATFKTWLLVITRQTAQTALRREYSHRKWMEMLVQCQRATDERAVDRLVERLTLYDCLARLEVKLREVLILRYMLGLSEDEIADRLSRPPGTIKSQLQSAKHQLRTYLQCGEETHG